MAEHPKDELREVVREELESERHLANLPSPAERFNEDLRRAAQRGRGTTTGREERQDAAEAEVPPDWGAGARGTVPDPPASPDRHIRAMFRATRRRVATSDADYWDIDE